MLTREDLRLATLLCFAFVALVLAFGFVEANCSAPPGLSSFTRAATD